jgi:hypothetical protein
MTKGMFDKVVEAGSARRIGLGQPRPVYSGASAHVWHHVPNGPGHNEILFDSLHAAGLKDRLPPTTKLRLFLVAG